MFCALKNNKKNKKYTFMKIFVALCLEFMQKTLTFAPS